MAEVAEATVTSAEDTVQDTSDANETAESHEAVAVSEATADTGSVYATDSGSVRTEPRVFQGSQRNVVVATALLLAGLVAFSMGMTTTFFAEATVWTFIIWGALLLFSSMLDLYQTYEVHEDALQIHNPVRFWSLSKSWAWKDINRLDIIVHRTDARLQDAMMHIYHTVEGEIVREREDRTFNPELAQLVIEKANLQPVDSANPKNLSRLPLNQKVTYHWTKNGSLV